ncbi:MAG TPA: pantothenate kinase, partial [Flavobacteriaceae bacterium]|nr:pantothenate kinase [Flavobacteriaceae bacterium]
MNLIVDVGNSFIKLAVFEKEKLVKKETVSVEDFSTFLKSLQKAFPNLDYAIVSSVGNFSEKHLSLLTKQMKVHTLSHASTLPFINKYETPTTLGVDRIAL